MFQDEADFGRINKPKYCWCEKETRPSVPCHHIREYRYAYGAVEPLTGDSCFLIMPYCNNAGHPGKYCLFYIPPYTPEMNPIEQIWKEIRKLVFKNEVFPSLDKVVDRLCLTICSLLPQPISHITASAWILNVFVSD